MQFKGHPEGVNSLQPAAVVSLLQKLWFLLGSVRPGGCRTRLSGSGAFMTAEEGFKERRGQKLRIDVVRRSQDSRLQHLTPEMSSELQIPVGPTCSYFGGEKQEVSRLSTGLTRSSDICFHQQRSAEPLEKAAEPPHGPDGSVTTGVLRR